MASRIPTALTTPLRQRALPRLTRPFATSPRRLSERQQEASFVRRVWADPQMRRIAIGGFVVMTGVEGYLYGAYGPRVWASLRGEGE